MTIPPDWDIEIRALREAATHAGLVGVIDPRTVGIELESADDLLARLNRAEAATDELAKPRSRRRRAILLASSVAAVGVLVAGVLQPWSSAPVQAATPALLDYQFASIDSIATAPGKSATPTLERLANAADADSRLSGSGDQYVVADSWFADPNTTSLDTAALIPQISEFWVKTDGSLRIVERRGDPLPADGRGLPRKGKWSDEPISADETQPAGSVDPDVVTKLPTQSDALRAKLLEITKCPDKLPGSGRSFCLYNEILALYQVNVVPPEVNAALWRVLAGEKDFRSLGEVKDRAGRPGLGISLITTDRPEYRNILIIDPKTGRLLGNEQILITSADGLKITPPAIMSFTAILESKYLD